MSKRTGTLSATGVAAIAIVLAVMAPAAGAAFGGLQMGSGHLQIRCSNCTYASPDAQFFTQAAGHPPIGITDFAMNTTGGQPERRDQGRRVDLPAGLSVNPQAVPQCPRASFETNTLNCAGSEVGISEVTSESARDPGRPLAAPGLQPRSRSRASRRCSASASACRESRSPTSTWTPMSPGSSDYHEGFTISDIPNHGAAGSKPARLRRHQRHGSFITIGSHCNAALDHHRLNVDSYENPGQLPALRHDAESEPGRPVNSRRLSGGVPFAPAIDGNPGTDRDRLASRASPSTSKSRSEPLAPLDHFDPEDGPISLPTRARTQPLRRADLTSAPTPSSARAPKARSPVPLTRRSAPSRSRPRRCPRLAAGNVFLGRQLSRDPASGQEYRIFVDAESARYGVSVRLIGNVSADPQTGQLTADLRRQPAGRRSALSRLQLNGGAKAPLTSPPICANTTSSQISPWSGNAAAAPTSPLNLSKAPGGGACAKTMAERPFAPGFKAAPKTPNALAFTPFVANITRSDGQQELKGVDITLPPGATAKLAGVPYCPPAALAAAAAAAGAAEKAKSSCPAQSQIGVATIAAGSGPSPLSIAGKAFLAGPYQGAPVSLAVITPGVAGPFDLGTVVVRVPLFVDPESAQIHAVTDAIPDVFGGAKLDIRSIAVNINKDGFTLNGTNCSKFATAGALKGGGADPTNPAAFSSFPVSDPVQLGNCAPLGFHPKLNLRLFGATKRAKNPRLRAILTTKAGDANMARVSVGLPHALFLDQASLGTVCTRPQFAAGACPKKSVYGRARAFTPLLGQPLEGPVYLRSSNNTLPDLVAHLQGQVDIDLVGRIDSFKGGIRTTFDRVPDVPVSKFVMTLPGGKHGLLEASKNLCKGKVKAVVQIKGQNGKKANKRSKLKTPCKKKSHRKKAKNRN